MQADLSHDERVQVESEPKRYLEVEIDDTLTWHSQIDQIV